MLAPPISLEASTTQFSCRILVRILDGSSTPLPKVRVNRRSLRQFITSQALSNEMLKHVLGGEVWCSTLHWGYTAKTESKKLHTLVWLLCSRPSASPYLTPRLHTIFIFPDRKFLSLVAQHPTDAARSMYVYIYGYPQRGIPEETL